MADWVCKECENENPSSAAACEACDEPRPASGASGESAGGKVVALIVSIKPVPGKDRLQQLSVDAGVGAPLTIVTNAPNVAEGQRVIVALVGTEVGGETVKKANVGGVVSEGMLCDAKMLGWVGGGAGLACQVPESFALGSAAPDKRPRMDGK